MGHKVRCVLCRRSQETTVTGPLSTKDDVTAHQNCLLFSSGLFCQDSPLLDDLFGFSVDDVRTEVKRGQKLKCHRCKTSGATAGCEVSRCKKSYHYPCAVEEGARVVEDAQMGKYGLYCRKHSETQNNNSSAKVHNPPLSKPSTSKNGIEAEPLKMNTNGESSGEGPSVHNNDSNSSSSSKRLSSKRGYSSDSSEGVSPTKRKARTISEGSSHSDENQPDSELAPLEFDMDERANSFPESDHIREVAEGELTSGNQHQEESKDENDDEDDTLVESTPQLKIQCLSMDCESESLLIPVKVCMDSPSLSSMNAELSTQTDLSMAEVVKKERTESQSEPSPVHDPDRKTTETSDPHDVPAASPPSSDHSDPPSVIGSPPDIRPDFTPSALEPFDCPTSPRSPPNMRPDFTPSAPEPFDCPTSPRSPPNMRPDFTPSAPEPFDCPTSPPAPSPRGLQPPSGSISDSASFWRSCNAACCTQAIFTGFIKEMNDIFKRIQSEEASQEDFDRASAVMEAWGKLADIVTKQQEEIQRKQEELEKMSRAMKEVVSALKR